MEWGKVRKRAVSSAAILLVFLVTLLFSRINTVKAAGIKTGGDQIVFTGGDAQLYDAQGKVISDGVLNIFGNLLSQEESVIAPGSYGEYLFSIQNDGDEALAYQLKITDDNIDEIPLKFRISKENNFIFGGHKEWRTIDSDFQYADRIKSGGKTSFILEWSWEFYEEEARDQADTDLGRLAAEREVLYRLNILAEAEQQEELQETESSGGQTEQESSQDETSQKVDDEENSQNARRAAVNTADITSAYPILVILLLVSGIVFVLAMRRRKSSIQTLLLLLLCVTATGTLLLQMPERTNASYITSVASDTASRAAFFDVKFTVAGNEWSGDKEGHSVYFDPDSEQPQTVVIEVENNGEVTVDCSISAAPDNGVKYSYEIYQDKKLTTRKDASDKTFRLKRAEKRWIKVTVHPAEGSGQTNGNSDNSVETVTQDIRFHFHTEQVD